MQTFQLYFTIITCSIFFTIGCFGNVISIVIFSNKEFINQPTTFYLISSNVVNLFVLLYLPVLVMPETWTLFTYSCKILVGISVNIIEIQSWLFSLCSIDRCVSTLAPYRFNFKNRISVQLAFIVTFSVIIIILNIPIIYFYENSRVNPDSNTTINICLFPVNNVFSWISDYSKYQFILFRTVIPFLITITSSLLTIYKLFQSKRRTNSSDFSAGMKKEFQFARSLIIMDLIFVIFRLPTFINTLINNDLLAQFTLLFKIFAFIGTVHNVFVFLIFIIFNKIYRKLFIKWVLCKKEENQRIQNNNNFGQ